MSRILKSVGRMLEWLIETGGFAWTFLRALFLSQAGAAARTVALESQVDVCLRQREGRRIGRLADAFRFLWVILEHGSRRVRHWNLTQSPSLHWIIRQLREAMPFGEAPGFMHRDNDGLYGNGVSKFLKYRESRKSARRIGRRGRIRSLSDTSAVYAVSCWIR